MSNFRAKGLETFFDVLEIIKSPEKFQEYLKLLQEETRKYQEVVEAVIELSKVNEYTLSIRQREEESKQLLQEAKIKAKELLEKATKQVEQKEATLVAAQQEIATKETFLKTKQSSLETLEKSLQSQAKDLALSKESFDKKHQEVQTLKAEFEDKLAKLKAIV